MDDDTFRHWSHRAADWGVDYRQGLADRPVRSPSAPGEVLTQIPGEVPENAESFEAIFADFERIIPDAMTHWQHPRFFAYFPSNAAPAAVIAEQLAGAMAAQGMLWQTSPALTELEIRMVDWLRQATGLPDVFKGVLQDTASTATLCAVLTMRERALQWTGNQRGLSAQPRLRVYASSHTHSSIDKALWIAGIGQDNLVKIAAQPEAPWAVDAGAMRAAIATDRAAGYLPIGIIACVGGTSFGASDDLQAVGALAREENLFWHVDAAWAGSAMICPEFRHYWQGIETADSIVFNPHKWLGVPMECSAHFVRDPETLVKTLAIQPEYLKTHGRDGVVNFSEWSVTLGRRFRALKLWFLLRHHGLAGLRTMIREHVQWAHDLVDTIRAEPDFEIVTEPMLSLFTFRYRPVAGVNQRDGNTPAAANTDDDQALDALNLSLVTAVNDDGRTYLTQTRVDGRIVIRFQIGPFDTTADHVGQAWQAVREIARALAN